VKCRKAGMSSCSGQLHCSARSSAMAISPRHFLPPMGDARRMFGGRRVRLYQPVRVGDRVERVSKVTRAEKKIGRSGPLTLVTVVHELSAGSGVAITEEQDIVYRTPVATGASTRSDEGGGRVESQQAAERENPDWSRTIVPDPVLLFRYSALTFNAHRIHYDLPYTRDVEGYPALVMNAGLTALLLVETARTHLPGRVAGYDARAAPPVRGPKHDVQRTIVRRDRR
jgi:3-methylfumaryl-CoA hydratase